MSLTYSSRKIKSLSWIAPPNIRWKVAVMVERKKKQITYYRHPMFGEILIDIKLKSKNNLSELVKPSQNFQQWRVSKCDTVTGTSHR